MDAETEYRCHLMDTSCPYFQRGPEIGGCSYPKKECFKEDTTNNDKIRKDV